MEHSNYFHYRYLNEAIRHPTQFTFKLLATKMIESGNFGRGRGDKYIDREREKIMRKNSVREAIRKSSRRNSSTNASRANSISSTFVFFIYVIFIIYIYICCL